MAQQDYIPGKEGKLMLWLVNYKAKLAEYKEVLKISDEDFKAQNNFVEALIKSLNDNTSAQQAAQQARTDLNTQKSTSVGGIRKNAQQIKKKNEYNNGIGEKLGIVGDENSIDIENSKPVLTAKKVENGWRLSFNLHGFFDAVKIYRQRPNETQKFIAVDHSSPYIDTDAQVNATSYTAYFLMGDETVGLESDPVVISI